MNYINQFCFIGHTSIWKYTYVNAYVGTFNANIKRKSLFGNKKNHNAIT